MGFMQEFKEFAVKGNAIDMAVGIVVGAAFTRIVNSVVNDLIMPPLGFAMGGAEFKDLKAILQPASTGADGTEIPEVAVRYGAFLNTIIEFLIVAFALFVVVKMMNKVIAMRGTKDATPA